MSWYYKTIIHIITSITAAVFAPNEWRTTVFLICVLLLRKEDIEE